MEDEKLREPIRMLHVEDNPLDAALVEEMLTSAGMPCQITRIYDQKGLEQALARLHFDIVVCDFSLPGFNGMNALETVKRIAPETPFIFVSGQIGEETAVQSLQHGAMDYLLKDRIARLPGAIKRALQFAESRAKEERLLRLTRAQSNLLEQASDAIFGLNQDLTISYCNHSAEKLYGALPGELLGKRAKDVIFLNETQTFDTIRAELRTHGVWSGIQTTSGDKKRHLEHRWNRVNDLSDNLFKVVVSIRDVTEERTLEATLLRTQRIESIGTIAAGVAHDVNNSLAPIIMGIDLLAATARSPEAVHCLGIMGQSARHCAELVSQITTFARGLREENHEVSLRSTLIDFRAILAGICPPSIRLEFSISEVLWNVRGSTTKLHQLIMNLCINARDAMPKGGTLRVQARNIPARSEEVPKDFAGCDCVRIVVQDTGVGIAPTMIGQIFDPFFTTKANVGGTGLGLALVRRIVEEHSGSIEVSSEVEKGSQFRVYLPALTRRKKEPEKIVEKIPEVGSGQTVLVIDDEVALCDMLSRVLKEAGFQVLKAEDGAAGLAAYLENRAEISLIVTDLSMPYLGGRQLIEIARNVNPRIKALICSGTVEEGEAPGTSPALIWQLTKPFTAAEFLSAVVGILRNGK